MKQLLFFIIIFTVLFSEPIYSADSDSLYLWSAKKGNCNINILGSIHAVNKDFYPLDIQIDLAFNQSDYLILEMIPDSLNLNDLIQKIAYPIGITLKDTLEEETYKQLIEYSQSYGLAEEYIKVLKPGYAMLTLSALELSKNGIIDSLGVDFIYLNKAHELNMTVLQLETPSEQIEIVSEMDNFSDEYIRYSFSELNATAKVVKEIMQAWKNGNDSLIIHVEDDDLEKFPEIAEFNQKLLYDRNIIMAERLDEIINQQQEGNYFVIVGTAHLIGEKNIIDLLRKKEYKIIRKTKE